MTMQVAGASTMSLAISAPVHMTPLSGLRMLTIQENLRHAGAGRSQARLGAVAGGQHGAVRHGACKHGAAPPQGRAAVHALRKQHHAAE